MFRMCDVLTIACATALVAGSVASAADKAAVASTKGATLEQANNQAPLSLRGLARDFQVNDSQFGLAGGCASNLWFNGAFDQRDAQASHLGGGVQYGAKAADDFYLCEGQVYDLNAITVTLITNSIDVLTKANLEIYADCNGAPGERLYTLTKGTKTETGQTYAGLRVVNWTFTPSNETVVGNQNIVLKGGAYWISAYGLTDGQCPTMNMCDVTYWGTAGNQIIKGSVAKKNFGVPTAMWNQYSFPNPWTSVEDCCVQCTDLAFAVDATPCKILVDNGEGRRQSTASDIVGSRSEWAPFSSRDSRSADDFVVPPCSDYNLCYVEGCVFTNCVGFKGVFDIYGNDCKLPSFAIGGTPLYTREATKIIDLNYNVLVNVGGTNVAHRAYKLEFHDLSYLLTGGRQYWIAIGVKHTFSINERAFFCYNADCARSCLIRWNPGQYLNPGAGVSTWTSVGNDFAFLLAANPVTTGGNNSTPTCVADFNRDGSVQVNDIFDFLSAWFTGCP